MSEKLPVFVFIQGDTRVIHFDPVDPDEVQIDLTNYTDILFSIKESAVDDDALISYQLSVDSEIAKVNNTEVSVDFASADLALLTPGDYVAEIQLFLSEWSVSDRFIFRVRPQIGVPA